MSNIKPQYRMCSLLDCASPLVETFHSSDREPPPARLTIADGRVHEVRKESNQAQETDNSNKLLAWNLGMHFTLWIGVILVTVEVPDHHGFKDKEHSFEHGYRDDSSDGIFLDFHSPWKHNRKIASLLRAKSKVKLVKNIHKLI